MKQSNSSLFLYVAVGTSALWAIACGPEDPFAQDTATLGSTAAQTGAATPVATEKAAPKEARLRALLKEAQVPLAKQNRLLALAQKAHQAMAPLHQKKSDLTLTVVNGIRQGNLDAVGLQHQVASLFALAEEKKPELAEALNQAHALLDRQERQALVQTIDAKHQERHQRRHGHQKLRQLASALGLSDQQKEEIFTAVRRVVFQGELAPRKQRQAMEKKWQAAAEAFVREDFDAHQLKLLRDVRQLAQKKITPAVSLANRVLGILSSEQRAAVAVLVQAKALEHQEGCH